MTNYEDVVGWLYDILASFDFRYTPLEIMQTEDRYPGLFRDLSIEAWQRRLIKEQLEGNKPGDGSAE